MKNVFRCRPSIAPAVAIVALQWRQADRPLRTTPRRFTGADLAASAALAPNLDSTSTLPSSPRRFSIADGLQVGDTSTWTVANRPHTLVHHTAHDLQYDTSHLCNSSPPTPASSTLRQIMPLPPRARATKFFIFPTPSRDRRGKFAVPAHSTNS